MKRITILCLAAMLLVSGLFAQGAKDGSGITRSPFSETEVNVVALKGPTAMGMVQLMDRAEDNAVYGNRYNFYLEAAPDAVVPKIVKGDVDIAAIPANLAAIVYNNTDKIQILGINTLGVLYICQNGDTPIASAEDLRGKTIYSAGRGSTPQYALEAVLAKAGLEIGKDVFVEWKSEHAECVAALIAAGNDQSKVAMLPQPFATTACIQNPTIKVSLDLNDAWESLTGSPLVTGVTVVRKDFAAKNPEAVEAFIKAYGESVAFANSDYATAGELVAKYGILPKAQIATKALPACNITLVTGEEMNKVLNEYFSTLYSFNPASVGGKLPTDAIYY